MVLPLLAASTETLLRSKGISAPSHHPAGRQEAASHRGPERQSDVSAGEFAGAPEVGFKLAFHFSGVLRTVGAQHGGRMVGRAERCRPRGGVSGAQLLGKPELRTEQRLRRGGAEASHHLGRDRGELGVEPRAASTNLRQPWRLMNAAFAPAVLT